MDTVTEGGQDTHSRLLSILPDDSYNVGQDDPKEEVSDIPNSEPEIKTETKPDTKTTDEETTAVEEPAEVEIDYEGSKYRLPKELKDAFLRQQDYTKKTMELAEQKKTLGQTDPKEIEEYKQKLSTYETLLGQQVAADQKIDWIKLLESDPIEYLKQKEISEARQREWQRSSQKRTTELAEQQRQTLNHEWGQLIAKHPEWKDEATFKADREKITKSLTEAGYKPEEISAIADHRALVIADKARKYDELMAAKSEVVKKIEKLPPKHERPGVSSDGQVNKTAMQSLRKTGSIDDAAGAIRSLMG